MIIDVALVQKLAHLARLGLSEEEAKKFANQLEGIVEFFADLQNVDTKGVKPLAQITSLTNALRADEVASSGIEKELLECTRNEIVNNHIVVPKAINN